MKRLIPIAGWAIFIVGLIVVGSGHGYDDESVICLWMKREGIYYKFIAAMLGFIGVSLLYLAWLAFRIVQRPRRRITRAEAQAEAAYFAEIRRRRAAERDKQVAPPSRGY